MKTIFFSLLIFTGACAPCFAAGDHHAHGPHPAAPAGGATDPAAAPATDPAADPTAQKNCAALNTRNPFDGTAPLNPNNRATRQASPANAATAVVTPVITDQEADAFQFPICENVRRGSSQNNNICDKGLGRTFEYFTNEKNSLDDLRKDITRTLPARLQGCSAGQTQAQQCTHDLYADVASKFQHLADKFQNHASALESAHTGLKDNSISVITSYSQPAKMNAGRFLTQADVDSPNVVAIRATAAAPTGACYAPATPNGGLGNQATRFCGLMASAAETRYFKKVFETAQQSASDVAKCFTGNAAKAQAHVAGGGSGNGNGDGKGDSTVTGKSGMGLDDLMKLATLGITGAGLYCTVTKSCSPSSSSDSATNSDTATSGATSPTPNATNAGSGPQSSSLGENKTAASSPLGPTASAPDTSSSFGHSGGSSGYDQALQHFNGALDSRAPASGSAPASTGASGGGSFGGIGGGSSSNPNAAAQPVDPSKSGDGSGSGNGVGGGGLASGGGTGFSLDSHAGAPADSALKNILNGDMPTSTDASMFPLGDAAAAQASGDAGAADPENLFVRTKDAHVRCLKRGCVGQGVGENI